MGESCASQLELRRGDITRESAQSSAEKSGTFKNRHTAKNTDSDKEPVTIYDYVVESSTLRKASLEESQPHAVTVCALA